MMTKLCAAILAVALLAVASAVSASTAPCATHADHAGAHERVSCGMAKLGEVKVSATAGLGQLEIMGSLAAVVQREEGRVALVDVADPRAPRVVGRYDGNAGSAAPAKPLDGDVAFSADGRYLFYARQTQEYSYEGLHVVDVSDPASPRLAGYAPGGGMLRVAYHQAGGVEYLVALDAVTGLVVYRFDRTPAGGTLVPVQVDALPELKVGGPASAGVYIDPRDPQLGVPLLYVSTGKTGLQVFDFSVPTSPRLLGAWSQQGLADITVVSTPSSRTVYAATEYWFTKTTKPEIITLDASTLPAIAIARRDSAGAYPGKVNWQVQGIEAAGGLLYVAHSHAGVGVFDGWRGDPPIAATTELGEGNSGGEFNRIAPYAMDVTVERDVLYVSDAAAGTLSTFALTGDVTNGGG